MPVALSSRQAMASRTEFAAGLLVPRVSYLASGLHDAARMDVNLGVIPCNQQSQHVAAFLCLQNDRLMEWVKQASGIVSMVPGHWVHGANGIIIHSPTWQFTWHALAHASQGSIPMIIHTSALCSEPRVFLCLAAWYPICSLRPTKGSTTVVPQP
jgi:hypothetical protein